MCSGKKKAARSQAAQQANTNAALRQRDDQIVALQEELNKPKPQYADATQAAFWAGRGEGLNLTGDVRAFAGQGGPASGERTRGKQKRLNILTGAQLPGGGQGTSKKLGGKTHLA